MVGIGTKRIGKSGVVEFSDQLPNHSATNHFPIKSLGHKEKSCYSGTDSPLFSFFF